MNTKLFKLVKKDSYEKFLLAEYENISKAYFDAKNSINVFFRYYLLIMMAPFTIAASVALKIDTTKINDQLLTDVIPLAALILAIVGFLLIIFIASSGLTTKLYAAQVNAIRQYYQHGCKNGGGHPIYSLLPSTPKQPETSHTDSLFYLFMTGAVIDSGYMWTFLHFSGTRPEPLFIIPFFLLHPIIYMAIASNKLNHTPKHPEPLA